MVTIVAESSNKGGRRTRKDQLARVDIVQLKQFRRYFTSMTYEKILDVGDRVVGQVIKMALEGNERMLILLWEHFKDKNFFNKLEEKLKLSTPAEVDASHELVVNKISAGEIDPVFGSNLAQAIASKRDSVLMKDLAEQVKDIVKGK